MKLTIIPEDDFVSIDGVHMKFDFTMNANYHAVQWDGTKGFIQTKKGPDIVLKTINRFKNIIKKHEKAVEQKIAATKKEEATQADIQAEHNLPINVWLRDMEAHELPDWAEDLIDTLDNLLPLLENLPQETLDIYNAKKLLRSEKPK